MGYTAGLWIVFGCSDSGLHSGLWTTLLDYSGVVFWTTTVFKTNLKTIDIQRLYLAPSALCSSLFFIQFLHLHLLLYFLLRLHSYSKSRKLKIKPEEEDEDEDDASTSELLKSEALRTSRHA